ncbi:nucleotide sugar dehydrogenase [bacterium]|nr:nucleotide sugar dehydrogenase [bacterium]
MEFENIHIGIVGLGYVGLPLAVEFAKKYKVTGFDINSKRVNELNSCIDFTLETTTEELKEVIGDGLTCSSNLSDISSCNIYIVTVPTPVDQYKKPDLTPVIKASESVGKVLKQGDVVIYESTVYPGCTEEVCVPILERESNLKFNIGFYCGYSPERINPGDKVNRLTTIKKVTSGSTVEIAKRIDSLYSSIVTAGTHPASSIKVAEAAKVIENSQRDINIAFVNELALIFDRLGIDTKDVLEAAGTKWNFLKFTPGLVGGHCIGVDPYYLTYKAESIGYNPQVILSGRRINDNMGIFVANKVVKLMIQKGIQIKGAKIALLGITFKENCPDIRNSKVNDLYLELRDFGCEVDVFDPWADSKEVKHEYNIDLVDQNLLNKNRYDGVILAVSHQQFKNLDINSLKKDISIVYDIKSFLSKDIVDGRL